jgi:hypothetical protein
VRRSNDEPELARDLLVERMSWFAPLVTHRRPLAEIADAFIKAERYENCPAKTVIY